MAAHDYIKADLGHAGECCRYCGGTPRENVALGCANDCPMAPEPAADISSILAPLEEKHRARALDAMASHFCTTDLTDGFCIPRDGKCRHNGKEQPAHRNCVVRARGAMQAMESRGCRAVWIFDKAFARASLTQGGE